jgi:hypothetical protein
MSMILYVPNYMHSSQLTQICNKEVSMKSLQEPYGLQIVTSQDVRLEINRKSKCALHSWIENLGYLAL